MSEYDPEARKLVIKLVYYGPAMSGKTTNLIQLHDLLHPGLTGELMTLETRDDRTLFFDMLPLGFRTASGLMIKLKLFTVPGQVQHDSTRKAVLSRADGVVFVADSQRNQGINNGESFQNLADNSGRVGLDFQALPLVVQFNKRDLPEILSEEEVKERWAGAPWPMVFATALKGEGVRETFDHLLDRVFDAIASQYDLTEKHGLDGTTFRQSILGNLS